jgi:hypothetical protein
MSAFMPDLCVQIDVKKVENGFVKCNLQTGSRDVQMFISESDYQDLIRDGFFLRDGKSVDSAGILNTTPCFVPEKKEEEAPEVAQTEDKEITDPLFCCGGPDYPY